MTRHMLTIFACSVVGGCIGAAIIIAMFNWLFPVPNTESFMRPYGDGGIIIGVDPT